MAQAPTRVTSVTREYSQERAAHTPSASSEMPSSSPVHHQAQLRAGQRVDEMDGAEGDQVPDHHDRHQVEGDVWPDQGADAGGYPQDSAEDGQPAQPGTRLATTSWVMPPNRNATPTNVATATKLPTW